MTTSVRNDAGQMGPRRKRYEAFHEAGHAVAGDFFAVHFTVTIDDRPQVDFGPRYDETLCPIMFAGPLAQAKYQRRGLAYVLLTAGAGDMNYINEQAEAWADIGLNDMKRQQWKQVAKQILKERWDLVVAVAERLIEHGRLSSEDVWQIACRLGHDGQDLAFPYD